MAKTNSWDQLPALETGDSGPDPIYRSVGAALTQFEILQDYIGWLFQAVLELNSFPLHRAFGTVENVPPRSKMIRAAAAVRFHDNESPRDEAKAALHKRVSHALHQYEKLSFRRNEIAHGYVTQFVVNGNDKRGCFLHPGMHATERNQTLLHAHDENPLGDYAYTSAQVDHYAKEFQRLYWEVSALNKDLWAITRTAKEGKTSG